MPDIIVRDENILTILEKPRGDVSGRATSIARLVDRLPPGDYIIELKKPEIKSSAWDLSAWKRERIQENRFE